VVPMMRMWLFLPAGGFWMIAKKDPTSNSSVGRGFTGRSAAHSGQQGNSKIQNTVPILFLVTSILELCA